MVNDFVKFINKIIIKYGYYIIQLEDKNDKL